MLPQVGYSSMDSDCTSPVDKTQPPDVCQKFTILEEGDTHPDAWSNSNLGDLTGGTQEVEPVTIEAMEVTDLHSAVTYLDENVAQADLLQSAGTAGQCDNTLQVDGMSSATALPDLCEGVNSCRELGSSSGNYSPTDEVTEACNLNSSSVEKSLPVIPKHQALGAKPKVFRYKSGSKIRADVEKHPSCVSRVALKNSNTQDFSRTIESSNVSLCNSVSDSDNNSDILALNEKSDTQFEESALTDISSENLVMKSECSIKDNYEDIHHPETNDDVINSSLDNEVITNLSDSDRDTAMKEFENVCLETEVNSQSLMDEFLFYDSRPISLVSCGIWDCSSATCAAADSPDNNSGFLLVRKNLHSASHPMFSKWPCEAYIPSHNLLEVAFNSHGTPLSATANIGISLPGSTSQDCDTALRENEQVKLAKRMGLIHHLPQGTVDAGTSVRECVICMNDLIEGERVRYLPCLHLYHTHCIDDWFQRAFTCPSCLEPVDAALLNTYNTT